MELSLKLTPLIALNILTKARRHTDSPRLHGIIDRILDNLEKETLHAAIKWTGAGA
jgi:hypothetical protein